MNNDESAAGAPLARDAARDLIAEVEEFCDWWSLHREGSVNAAYDYIDKLVKWLRPLIEPAAALHAQIATLQQELAEQEETQRAMGESNAANYQRAEKAEAALTDQRQVAARLRDYQAFVIAVINAIGDVSKTEAIAAIEREFPRV